MTRVDKVEPMRISLLAVDRVDKVEPTLDCSGSTSADTFVKDGTSKSQGNQHDSEYLQNLSPRIRFGRSNRSAPQG